MDLEGFEEFDDALVNRYFNPETIVCRFCRNPGHKFKDCPQKKTLCHLCGADHDPIRCPLADICWHCCQRGHTKSQCPDKSSRRHCQYCSKSTHSTLDCHLVWRSYKKRHASKRKIQTYCYNCAGESHFGDECPQHKDQFQYTAFSIFALPEDKFKPSYSGSYRKTL
ncbi:hypothetical protein EDD86DRAFT_207456 [Gorgonomyces haynaldii]|nr:hypothetical protein EDD86DRAFT_207456 [Gorgonomyces haynaldii]